MPDSQSIEDLLKKTKASSGPKKLSSEMDAGERFAEKMADIRLKEKETETEREAARSGYPYADLVGFPISPDAISSIPRAEAEKMRAACFLNTGTEIRIGAMNPSAPEIEEIRYQLAERFHANAAVYMISAHSLESALKIYDSLPSVRKISKGVTISEEDIGRFTDVKSFGLLQSALNEASITDIVTILVAASLNTRSSDMHIEAEEKEIVVRFRIDGVLTRVASIKSEEWGRMISRVKLLSGLKINVTSEPQDGRFTIYLKEEKIDVRVSTIPTAYGESVVMRLLRSSAAGISLDSLGFRPPYDALVKSQLERPNGMIITTGPTGSGKTTTLYAMLRRLNTPDVKIITLEDPVEYKLEGIAQSQIDHSKDYTFAKGLRSILRQDPDVIMVGEIRDLETAETAIQAALTGHLLLSTIHTNDAAGAIPRFMSMGVKPFLLAPALNCIIGQRLCRTIHEDCKEEMELEPAVLQKVKKTVSEISPKSGIKIDADAMKFYRGKGCDKCSGIGYKGRVGIYEILAMSPEIEKAILAGNVSEYQMRDIAKDAGMITMAQDGILKALDGITTVDEVFRVAE